MVVEQSVNVALELAERAVFLEKGEVRFSGRTVDLLDRPDILRSVFIAGAELGRRDRRDPRRRADGPPRAASAASALLMADPPAHPAVGGGTGHPGVQRRAQELRGIAAIQDISLTLRDGEILGLIGHNGAGKTTFFDCVSGFLPLDGGRIRLGGVDIDTWPGAHARRGRVSGAPSKRPACSPSLTVVETIAVAQDAT